MTWPHASDELIEIIVANECNAQLGLATSRFRRLANEIERLRAREVAMLDAIRHYNPDDAFLDAEKRTNDAQ